MNMDDPRARTDGSASRFGDTLRVGSPSHTGTVRVGAVSSAVEAYRLLSSRDDNQTATLYGVLDGI
jgi:hypothetical protein